MNLGRNRSTRLALDIVIDLVPMIDVVFMLLIFFVVTTTFKHESQLNVALPEATADKREPVTKPLEIIIDAEGRYYVNRKQVINTHISTLKQAMVAAVGQGGHPPLIISADAKTPHQSVVTAMDAARQLGFERLSIATNETKKER